MSYTALNQRLNNAVEWKTPEIFKACELLDIPLAEAHLYFFTLKVQKQVLFRSGQMNGENILRTLIELLEAQEKIKVTYQIHKKEKEEQ